MLFALVPSAREAMVSNVGSILQ